MDGLKKKKLSRSTRRVTASAKYKLQKTHQIDPPNDVHSSKEAYFDGDNENAWAKL